MSGTAGFTASFTKNFRNAKFQSGTNTYNENKERTLTHFIRLA